MRHTYIIIGEGMPATQRFCPLFSIVRQTLSNNAVVMPRQRRCGSVMTALWRCHSAVVILPQSGVSFCLDRTHQDTCPRMMIPLGMLWQIVCVSLLPKTPPFLFLCLPTLKNALINVLYFVKSLSLWLTSPRGRANIWSRFWPIPHLLDIIKTQEPCQ